MKRRSDKTSRETKYLLESRPPPGSSPKWVPSLNSLSCSKPALWSLHRDVCTSQLPVLIRAASTPMQRAQNPGINWSNPAVTIVFIIFGAICCRAQKRSFRKGYLRDCASVADGNQLYSSGTVARNLYQKLHSVMLHNILPNSLKIFHFVCRAWADFAEELDAPTTFDDTI